MKFYKVFMTLLFLLISQSILSAQDSLYLIGTIQGEPFGNPIFNIQKVGDINGDGYNDFIISIPKSNYCEIYLGSDDFDLKPDIILESPSEIYDYGFFLGDVGDVNKDGYDDFIIQGKYDPLYFIGQVFLYLGGENFDTIPDFTFRDYFIQDALGASISGGDVNGDGYSDFIIGNPYNWSNGIGRAYLFLGGELIVDTPYVTFISDSVEDSYGDNVSLDGDINNDGFNDVLISAPNIGGNPNSNTKIFVYYGNTTFNTTVDTVLNYSISYAPVSTFYVPDFNGDGFGDFFVPIENKLIFGSNDFSASNYLMFSNSEDMDNFGETGGSGGDINNDGYDDLILGATNHRNTNGVMVGGTYIFLGSSQPDTIPDFFVEGETKWSNFGMKVGSLGDINGDGYDEIYVLAPNYPNYENPLGKVYIYSMKKFVVGVEEEKQIQILQTFKLYQNYPNPFNPSTTLSYSLPSASDVKLVIYDVMGRMIKSFAENSQSSGTHKVVWDGTNSNGVKVSTGIYIYRFEATSLETNEHFVKSEKLMLVK